MNGAVHVRATFRGLLGRRSSRGDTAEAPKPTPPPVSLWHSVAVKYDICRMTRSELQAAAQELFAGGAISLPDLRVLSLHPDTQAPDWPDWATFQTPGERGGRKDWIFEVEARLAAGHPDPMYLSYQLQLLGLFKRLQNARLEMQPPAPQPEPARPQPWAASPALARFTQAPANAGGVAALAS